MFWDTPSKEVTAKALQVYCRKIRNLKEIKYYTNFAAITECKNHQHVKILNATYIPYSPWNQKLSQVNRTGNQDHHDK